MDGARKQSELVLRAVSPSHSDSLFAIINDHRDELSLWLPWVDSLASREDCSMFIDSMLRTMSRGKPAFALEVKGRLAGFVGFVDQDSKSSEGELFYWLLSDFRGKGFASTSVSICVRLGFEVLSLKKLHIRCHRENTASQALALRVGFQPSSSKTSCDPELRLYSMTASEFEALTEELSTAQPSSSQFTGLTEALLSFAQNKDEWFRRLGRGVFGSLSQPAKREPESVEVWPNWRVSSEQIIVSAFFCFLGRLFTDQSFLLWTETSLSTKVSDETNGCFSRFVPISLSISVKTSFHEIQRQIAGSLGSIPAPGACPLFLLGRQTSGFKFFISSGEKPSGFCPWLPGTISLFLQEDGPVFLRCDPKRYAPSQLARSFRHFYDQLTQSPEIEIDSHQLLSEEDRERVTKKWNQTSKPYPAKTVDTLFQEQVARTPDKVALVEQHNSLTYLELNRKANSLAHEILRQKPGPNQIVGVLLEPSFELVVSILAVLKAGLAYLPLNPEYPESWLSQRLKETGIQILLCLRNPFSKNEDLVPLSPLQSSENDGPPTKNPEPGALMVLHLTSGTSGRPKAVSLSHRNLVRLVKNNDVLPIVESDTVAFLAQPAFDASSMELWSALLNGARLAVISRHLSLRNLVEALDDMRVTVVYLSSGLFHALVEAEASELKTVRLLLCGGDVVNPKMVELFRRRQPEIRFFHVYGPTENGILSTYLEVEGLPEELEPVPLGRPISNTSAYILDSKMRPLLIGIDGEICVGGDGVALGYFRQDALTERVFLPNPFQPEPDCRIYRTGDFGRYLPGKDIEFLGRRDSQIKIRGFRVDLAEIEMGLRKLVDEAVVLVVGEGSSREIAAFVANFSGKEESLLELLNREFPSFMVPTKLRIVDKLPLTSRGKIDRQALLRELAQEPSVGDSTHTESGTEVAKIAEQIWQDVLRCSEVRPEQGFFELGGHSLHAVRIIHKLELELGKSLSLQDLYENPKFCDFVSRLQLVLGSSEESNESTSIGGEKGHSLSRGLLCALSAVLLLSGTFGLEFEAPSIKRQEKKVARPGNLFSGEVSFSEFARQFDLYWQKNFGFRKRFIQWDAHLNQSLGHLGPSQLLGLDHWWFLGEAPHRRARLMVRKLERSQQAGSVLATENIRLILSSPPLKQQIYPEMLPPLLQGPNALSLEKRKLLMEKLSVMDSTSIKLLDFHQTLVSNKGEEHLFFSQNTHWTPRGAFLAYKTVESQLHHWFPETTRLIEGEDIFRTGTREQEVPIAQAIGLVNQYHSTSPLKLREKNWEFKNKETGLSRIRATITVQPSRPHLPRALILCDSMTDDMQEFLSEQFSFAHYQPGANLSPLSLRALEEMDLDIVLVLTAHLPWEQLVLPDLENESKD